MDVLRHLIDAQSAIRKHRQQGRSIAMVPTMGALHAGHLSLVEAARAECDVVIATIFVNPTQFGPGEDFDQYPRSLETDLDLCRSAGTDLVFTPPVEHMYPAENATTVRVTGLAALLEGRSRPTHFDGVTTVVAKLLNIIQPDRAYFGQKDFQQQLVIRRMVEDLNWPVQVVTCPIIREPDGLAMSSRNRYLSAPEREQALILNRTLAWAEQQAAGASPAAVQAGMVQRLQDAAGVELDYAMVADPHTLLPAAAPTASAVALLAARVGRTRLIDNRMLTFAG